MAWRIASSANLPRASADEIAQIGPSNSCDTTGLLCAAPYCSDTTPYAGTSMHPVGVESSRRLASFGRRTAPLESGHPDIYDLLQRSHSTSSLYFPVQQHTRISLMAQGRVVHQYNTRCTAGTCYSRSALRCSASARDGARQL